MFVAVRRFPKPVALNPTSLLRVGTQNRLLHPSRPCLEGPKVLKSVAKRVKEELAEKIKTIPAGRKPPCLAVILVGSRKDSETYVRSKKLACHAVGIKSLERNFPENATQEEVLSAVQELNRDPDVHGILVQLPLPKHMEQRPILEAISRLKDVDGLTKANHGDLFVHGTQADLIPCTPLGCLRMLQEANIKISGSNAVVLGRSNLVGKPIALLLQSQHATVTMCHSKTKDLHEIVKKADIVVAALGVPEFVKREWIKPGATIIDVGINSVKDASVPKGYRLVGDVDYEACKNVAGAITPVPGGVGPMTVAMLLQNTYKAWELQQRTSPP
eukprot:gb/GEZN01011929.1/.p1 GENE.gb/GEZN01011929.1/~~gb/GEZN01011929.1/.p1  ORF type:complete len:330 (+),score=34.28 gb/GEZN01011929.1/:31-1020(+)